MWHNPLGDRAVGDVFPLVSYHESREYAERDLGEPIMEFRLVYEGDLFAEKSFEDFRQPRLKHKQKIRRYFHNQLCELWKVDSRLKNIALYGGAVQDTATGETKSFNTYFEALGFKYQSGGIKWVPLLTDDTGTACSLNVLFLRHEPKGGIIQSGDLDNRIKTLFDALRIPDKKEIPDDVVPENEPEPFFCLLSNDKLITDFRVTADRLLLPSQKPQSDSDVHLIIEVRTFITDYEKAAFRIGANPHK